MEGSDINFLLQVALVTPKKNLYNPKVLYKSLNPYLNLKQTPLNQFRTNIYLYYIENKYQNLIP